MTICYNGRTLKPPARPHQPHDQEQHDGADRGIDDLRDDTGAEGEADPGKCQGSTATSARSARMHLAIRSGPTCTLGGRRSTQRASAKEQRGANEQLPGALSSEGGVPGIVSNRWPRLAPWTVAANSPRA